ncbi:MAG: DNA mismatch repair protein MutS [Endomicrobiales bacterium]|nr:DNA mismatch repair protein MutS [Endomicrobiales bacterium]
MAKKTAGDKEKDNLNGGLTPLMRQYQDIKSRYPGAILFFRLGDFYEMFGEDAIKASPILEVVLTKRQEVPMCGVPHHAVNSYLRKLIKAGEKVAVCEQLEEPASAAGRPGRGIVKRGVLRVITPGTVVEENLLDHRLNNYLVSLCPDKDFERFGLTYVDISTGEIATTEVEKSKLRREIFRLSPAELVIPQNHFEHRFFSDLSRETATALSPLDGWLFSAHEAAQKIGKVYKTSSLKPFGLESRLLAASSTGAILSYIENTQIGSFPVLDAVRFYSLDDFLLIDENAVRNLELVEGLSTNSGENSLLEAIDSTLTPMGARMFRQRLLQPLVKSRDIKKRHDAVGFFFNDGILRKTLREAIKGVSDVERILNRAASGTAGPRDLIALKDSLVVSGRMLEEIKNAENEVLTAPEMIKSVCVGLEPPKDIIDTIGLAVNNEPPATLKDGNVIRDCYSPELDELRTISRESKKLISDMEAGERERTGISSLKIGYTSVFGYYIEVTKPNLRLVPQGYIRKQTVANGERFITQELKDFEEKILSADEKIAKLEEALFKGLLQRLLKHSEAVKNTASSLAELDVYLSCADTAALHGYVRPEMDDSTALEISEGRHPIVERKLKSGSFVANDISLDGSENQIMILTGPNMAGKSTYLRQTALIAILAQMGSFVPAQKARIGVIDKIFTRIGSGDNLAGGESTFMVEMHETANILNQNTPRSLVILDEMGRGTSTYDGISIAWAAIEYLSNIRKKSGFGPKVLFATHYFELTDLEGKLPGIKNFNVSVREWEGNVVFLHKIAPGAADRSYGIHVAQLAGLPQKVIKRASGILTELENETRISEPSKAPSEPDLFTLPYSKFMIELGEIEIEKLTPLEALQKLSELKKKYTKN